MPPAAPDDLIRQNSQSLGDNASLPLDQNRKIQEYEPTGKAKKKGKGGKKNKGAKAATETLPAELSPPSPDQPPAEPSSCPDPPLNHHAKPATASPVFDALPSFGDTPDHDLACRTDTWAKSVPFGKSPPNDLMNAEIPNESFLNFPTIQERGGFSNPSSVSSPPRTQPYSYGSGPRSDIPSRQQSIDRRKSHSYGSPMSTHPPLPHLPQAHFYGAPDIDLLSTPNRAPTDRSYSFCSFDTLPSSTSKMSRLGMNVLLVGTDGAVEVLAIEDRRTRLIGQITGLNGRVMEAKLVQGYPSSNSFASTRPHVVVIIHGPLPPSGEEGCVSAAGSDANEVPPSVARGHTLERRTIKDEISCYQTSVEVYSLRTGELVATLFASKPVPCAENIPGLPSFAPPAAGSLKLFTSGNHIILASGVSGEVYIYRLNSSSTSVPYQCVGKTWTSIQPGDARRYSTSSSSTDPDGSRSHSPHGSSTHEKPILAVQGRWLAVVPSSSACRGSLQGTVPFGLIHGKVSGIETRSPPSMPSVNCATDVGDGESFLDRVARGVTQELVRGARWMGDHGLQAWNNYWNNPQVPGTPPRRPVQPPEPPTQGFGLFPPTHAQETQTSTPAEPDTISIIDLKRLDGSTEARNVLLQPVATFQVPNGCSFLSLSPNGLMLFTASRNGDVHYVWDLMQLKHCRAAAFVTDGQAGQSPNVRQVARYPRLTTSSIVDVIWTSPLGERLAIITRKGTIHAFDLPRSAFQWPPFRRARSSPSKLPAPDSTMEEIPGQATAGNPLSAAMKLVGGKAQPFFSAVRDRVPSSGAAFPQMSGFALPSAASMRSGKVVAAGLSKSMGAATGTVNTLRHVGENRLHLAGLARDPAPSRVTWICNKGLIQLGVIDDGSFKLYRLKRAVSPHKNRQSHSVIGGREVEFKLSANLQNPCGPAPVLAYDPEMAIHASLALPSASSQPSPTSKPFCQPLSQAEIETNTPYQPFHTDQRVGLYIFTAVGETSDSMQLPSNGQWVFGDDIPTTKLHVRPFSNNGDNHDEHHNEDDDEGAAVHGHPLRADGDMENLITLGNSTGNFEEVVITTRRKKKHSTPLKADDGFFEDDCDVLDFAQDRV